MDEFLAWVDLHPSLAGWIQGVGTFLAALVALIAAALAYGGAIRQADATRDVQRAHEASERRALAAALFAEMSDCRARLSVAVHKLKDAKETRLRHLPVRRLDIAIFNASLGDIGKLTAPVAYAVVQMFKVLIDLDRDFEAILASDQEDGSDTFRRELLRSAEHGLKMIAMTAPVLGEVADLSQEELQAIDKPLARFSRDSEVK